MADANSLSEQDMASQSGNFIKDFRIVNHKIKRDLRIGFGILLFILAAFALFVGIVTSWQAVLLHGRAVLLRTLPYPILIFLISLLTATLLFVYERRHRHDKVSLYENGLVIQSGKSRSNWLWESTKYFNTKKTESKFGTSVVSEKYQLTFENAEGQVLTLPGRYADMSLLVEQIRRALLPRMYKRMVSLLRNGNTIRFSPNLSVVLKGVMINRDLCRWVSFNPPQILRRVFSLSSAVDNKTIYQCPTKEIKNLDLLLTVLENPPS